VHAGLLFAMRVTRGQNLITANSSRAGSSLSKACIKPYPEACDLGPTVAISATESAQGVPDADQTTTRNSR
ncbi:MAG: hypothetical protein WCK04_03545, partial [Actinomycetes bacterium]